MRSSGQTYSPSKGERIRGWILDLYPGKTGDVIVWIKTEDGRCLRLVEEWRPFFYVSAPYEDDLSTLMWYVPREEYGIKYEFVEKFVRLNDDGRSKVLKVTVSDALSLRSLARMIWRLGDYGKYRLWNVDIPLSQMYLYDRDFFPLAYVEATVTNDGVSWKLMDSAESVEYSTPPLKIVSLKVEIDKEGVIPSFEDPISRLLLRFDDGVVTIDSGNEGEKILRLVETLRDEDPDIILTDGGDSFLFTYLARRALKNNVLNNLTLGRERTSISVLRRSGNSYFSYGRVYYRAAPQRLLGRLHIDIDNSGLYAQYGLEGLMEVARTCRIPLHRASRVSIGSCMTDSTNRVPELGYNICERRVGIVPKVLELMLKKRMYYKTMRDKAGTAEEKLKYDQRQAAYKIILCTCFGYLGYRNARFGKVDAHIAACAFARKTLLDTARLAEGKGFEIVHGIVDSLYLKKKGATDKDFIELCKEITEETGLPISYEGRYRWIVFLPSKTHFGVPVLNRFYGVFQDGKVKARGIELRRGDTPNIVRQCQDEVIQELAKAKNSEEFIQRIPNAFSVLRKYARKIVNHEVDIADLVISKQLSKNPDRYVHNIHQATAARHLLTHGVEVTAGQTISYIIVDADNSQPESRVAPTQLIDANNPYDAEKYLQFLTDAVYGILSPFSYNIKKISTHISTYEQSDTGFWVSLFQM